MNLYKIRKQILRIIFILTLLFVSLFIQAQVEIRRLTLEDAIALAKQQSPDALLAKHQFRSDYWQYKSFKASYLPSLVLSGYIPSYSNSINKIKLVEGDIFSRQTINNVYAGLAINQKIGLTGGNVSLNSDVAMVRNFLNDSTYTEYNANLINITLRQPLVKYNRYKWERRLEPMLYNEAKKVYLESMEQVSLSATNHFFNLLSAQIDKKIALINEANYDTLYKIAQGRYELGKIAENELLQLELQYLRAGSDVKNATLQVEDQMFKFKSFLRIQDDLAIKLIEPSNINQFSVNPARALEEARYNSSEALSFNRQLVEAESMVAEAKYDGRFDAELFAVYGLSNFTSDFQDLPNKPQDVQTVELGITVPILDWGVAKGKLKMAESNQEIVRTNVEQQQLDFDQKVFLLVAQFNMQYDQVNIAAKSDTVGQKRYDITKARYLIGKISITDLNIAQTEADNSKKSYFNTLWRYWRYYYDLRRTTLFDFKRDMPIMVNYKDLL